MLLHYWVIEKCLFRDSFPKWTTYSKNIWMELHLAGWCPGEWDSNTPSYFHLYATIFLCVYWLGFKKMGWLIHVTGKWILYGFPGYKMLSNRENLWKRHWLIFRWHKSILKLIFAHVIAFFFSNMFKISETRFWWRNKCQCGFSSIDFKVIFWTPMGRLDFNI